MTCQYTNYLQVIAYEPLKNKTAWRGVNRNNTDYSLIQHVNTLFTSTAPLSAIYKFYLDIDNFITEYGIGGFKLILPENWLLYSKLITSASKLPRLPISKYITKEIYTLLNVANYEELSIRNKYCNFSPNMVVKGRKLISKDRLFHCMMCDYKAPNKRALVQHYTKEHNQDYYQITNYSFLDQYCISCKTKLRTRQDRGTLYVNRCKNPNCSIYQENKRKHLAAIAYSVANRTPKQQAIVHYNCSVTAIKRDNSARIVSDETKRKISESIKKRIEEGTFTPPVTNSWCRSRCYLADIPLRSTWELFFLLLNRHLKYEYTRIPYYYKKKWRNYITDFTDIDQYIVYEIKPSTEIYKDKNLVKHLAAQKWCVDNGYTYIIITEAYFSKYTRKLQELIVGATLDSDTYRKAKNALNRIIQYENKKNN